MHRRTCATPALLAETESNSTHSASCAGYPTKKKFRERDQEERNAKLQRGQQSAPRSGLQLWLRLRSRQAVTCPLESSASKKVRILSRKAHHMILPPAAYRQSLLCVAARPMALR